MKPTEFGDKYWHRLLMALMLLPVAVFIPIFWLLVALLGLGLWNPNREAWEKHQEQVRYYRDR